MLRLIGILAAAAIAGAASAQSVTTTKTSSSSTATLSGSGGTGTATIDGQVVESKSFPSGTRKVTVRTRTRTGQTPQFSVEGE